MSTKSKRKKMKGGIKKKTQLKNNLKKNQKNEDQI
jgi:hypothetical protein